MTPLRLPRRAVRPAVGMAAVVVLGLTLSSCSNDGQGLARQACAHVSTSSALLKKASHVSDTDPSHAQALQEQAEAELRTALPIAAEAAYDNGQWQALMTTLSESNRVAPASLMPALADQCSQATSSPFNQAPPPSSIPPPAPVNSSS